MTWNDPYDTEAELRQAMAMCAVEIIPHGHRATFLGHSGSFCESKGPNEWTEEMARKLAVLFWALEMREAEAIVATIADTPAFPDADRT